MPAWQQQEASGAHSSSSTPPRPTRRPAVSNVSTKAV
jgi:hypothetical protein